MPTLRIHKYNESKTHFFTLRVVEWINIFTERAYTQIIIESLKFCRKEKGLLLHAYVIMPNHLHILASAQNKNLSSIIRDFKSFASYKILAS
ncbi:transposase [Candidatus Dojkabacteria bacterium]|nr:transposase [Candidatus Dojkabacteria bacterium]